MDLRTDPDQPLPPAPDPWAGSEMPSRRDGPPFHMTEMIEAEPAMAARILRALRAEDGRGGAAARLATAIREAAGRGAPTIVTGCGTSEHGAIAVAAVLREAMQAAGLPWRLGEAGAVVAAQALEAALDDGLASAGALVVGVSHEGGTWATNLALERAKATGATVALITCSDRSPGAAVADIVVTTEEQDQSWCHTVGYVSPIVAGLAVGARLSGTAIDDGEVSALLAAGLAEAAVVETERLAAVLADVDRLIVVGSGADRAAARELVLKVEEGAHLPAAMRELETLLHGHLAGMDARIGLVLILADATRRAERAARASNVLAAANEIGATVGAILGSGYEAGLSAALSPAGRVVVPAPASVPPAAAALLASAVPLQLLTERLARARGIDPDPIRRDQPAYLRAAEVAG